MAASYQNRPPSGDLTASHLTSSGTTFDNPLKDTENAQTPDPCILVIFGASGDLTGRKLIPALYNLMQNGELPANFICVGFARRQKTHEEFRAEMKEHIQKFSRTTPTESDLNTFTNKLYYHVAEFNDDQGYQTLNAFLKDLDKKFGTQGNRVFYLSVQSTNFEMIVEKLQKHGLVYNIEDSNQFSRVIIEKPFGRDYNSAVDLQKNLTHSLNEKQIYRIDHYLGKETVQNLLVFRFSNSIFEGLWNNRYVDNIQITVAESIGIETRGAFYESEGLLRDIIQNHLMQLLCLVAMEPPINLSPDAIRDEKVKVLQAIQPFTAEQIETLAIRGQYKEGFIEGEPVVAYRKEDRVDPHSNVETFAALKMQIENWRWSGVPIYIRAGKRLPKRSTEIVVTFKRTPNILFHKQDSRNNPNQVIFRIQPNEGIAIKFNTKVPATTHIIQPVNMDFQYAQYFGKQVPEAYERLISDCILGDSTLFARVDESLNSWKFFTPIIDYWKSTPLSEEEFYPAGTWGPEDADFLLKKNNHRWKPL